MPDAGLCLLKYLLSFALSAPYLAEATCSSKPVFRDVSFNTFFQVSTATISHSSVQSYSVHECFIIHLLFDPCISLLFASTITYLLNFALKNLRAAACSSQMLVPHQPL